MNKKKLLLISIPVVLGGVLLYFLTRGKGKGKQKEQKQERGGGTPTTTTTTTTSTGGGGKLSNNFPLTLVCDKYNSKDDYENGYPKINTPVGDWDLYVITPRNKKSRVFVREISILNHNQKNDDSNTIILKNENDKNLYNHFYAYDDMMQKYGDIVMANKDVKNKRFREVFARKINDGTHGINDGRYRIWETGQCDKNYTKKDDANFWCRNKEQGKCHSRYYIEISLLTPLKEYDPTLYQEELKKIKSQKENKEMFI